VKRKTKFVLGGCGLLILVLAIAAPFAFKAIYRAMDASYQESADRTRTKHADEIASLVFEYAEETGKLPFQDQSKDTPFMVLIGRSEQAEDAWAQEEVLKKGATFTNSSVFEAELSKGLGRDIVLPRDPQKVPTFAPNVYVYFIADGQFTVVAHLFSPSDRSVEYQWRGGTFHSHTLSYSKKDPTPAGETTL